ncbi:MAG: hypothetical protein H6576_01245 [Lewinellaceae bacterium]|nr:hypothetical protein [Saprospiraceae bacterium]MCB9342304.1 hypothetical protein [Lewinellaceae bacterium]
MHQIEPYYNWREVYVAEEDERSPFYKRQYSEFDYTHKLYNYYLHPQWDGFGSSTLYGKIIYADYDEQCVLIELIGEWNDALHNDIMFFKRNVIDPLLNQGISKFALFCENVLNFHSSDDEYYAEWVEEVHEEGGWIACINTRQHVMEEMQSAHLEHYMYFGENYNDLHWRPQKPLIVYQIIDAMVHNRVKRLTY